MNEVLEASLEEAGTAGLVFEDAPAQAFQNIERHCVVMRRQCEG